MVKYLSVKTCVCFMFLSMLQNSLTIADEMPEHVSSEGRIALPSDFRKNMVHMGSWFVADGEASGFHDVYTEVDTITHYRRTGKFPDGATLVKELRAHTTAGYTTGQEVSFANDAIKQTFVMVKDATNRFSNNGNWGEGWGWALFKPNAPTKNVSTNYKTDCLGCHVPAKKTDWIYVEGYPSLKSD